MTDLSKERGIWLRNGLDPEFVPVAASAAQLKQQVDAGVKVGLVNTAEVLLARSQGTPVKVVAAYFGETIAKIFTPADSTLKTPKDLDAKRIGVLSATHTSRRAILYMNAKLGIKAEPVALGNLASNLAALKAGAVDAIYSSEGAALPLVDAGELKTLLPLSDVYPRSYAAVVVWAADNVIEQRPDLVRRFVKAVLETVSEIRRHPDEAVELYVKQTNASRQVASRAVAESNKFLVPHGRGSGQNLVDAVAGNWQFTKDSGTVPPGTEVNVSDVVDVRFL